MAAWKDDNYSPWFPNEPSNGAGKEYCVSAVNGKWQTLRCGFPWRFVCEKPGVKECPSDYTYYKEDDSCLKAHSDKKSFHAAREVCKAEGGDLARLDNGNITSFAVDMEPSYFWLGAWDPQKNNHWQFLDGSPVGDFHPWDNGEPNNYRKREHCVMAYGQTSTDRPGKWNDAYCEMSLAFVCQI